MSEVCQPNNQMTIETEATQQDKGYLVETIFFIGLVLLLYKDLVQYMEVSMMLE